MRETLFRGKRLDNGEWIERESVSADGCDEVSKIKTPFAWIIVEGTAAKPHYSILWWDTEKRECYVGYSSYSLEYVFNWLKENFEITEEYADVAPVRHGRWDNIPNTYMCVSGKDGSYHGCATSCSVCHEINPNAYKTNYCPNCGAKMDLEVTNDA